MADLDGEPLADASATSVAAPEVSSVPRSSPKGDTTSPALPETSSFPDDTEDGEAIDEPPSGTVATMRKRERESMEGGATPTPTGSEADESRITHTAKKNRLQPGDSPRASSIDGQDLDDDLLPGDEDEERASPSTPPETVLAPPIGGYSAQSSHNSQQTLLQQQRESLQETRKVASIRQKVGRMTTNDSLRAATLQTAAAPDEAGQEDDGAKTPTGVGSPKAATADSGSSPRPVAETVVAAPAPLTAANLAERTAAERSAADLDAAKSRSVSPKSPRSQPTFASFSGASSPFSQVPTTSKTSLGAADSSLAKVPPAAVPVFTSASLPLVTPEAPSPASSVRVEVASEAPGLSRQNSLQPASSPSTAGARISKLDKPSASVASKSPEPLAVPPPTPATNKTDLSNSQSPTLAIKPLSGIAERGANAASPTPSTSSSTSMGFGAFSGGSGFAAAKPTPAKPSSGFGGFSSSASPFGATPSKSFGTTSADIAGPSSTLTPSMRKMNDPSSKRTFGQIIRDGSPAEDGASTEDARKRLFSEQSSFTGEEEEFVMHTARCKLFIMDEGNWRERGVGTLKVLNKMEDATAHLTYRLVMRAEGVFRLLLNMPLFKGMSCELAQEKFIRFSGLDQGKMRSFTLRLGTAAAAQSLYKVISVSIDQLDTVLDA